MPDFSPTPDAKAARLDPDGTAKGKTILTAPVVGHNGPVPFAGPASAHVDTETGKRTELAPDAKAAPEPPVAVTMSWWPGGPFGKSVPVDYVPASRAEALEKALRKVLRAPVLSTSGPFREAIEEANALLDPARTGPEVGR